VDFYRFNLDGGKRLGGVLSRLCNFLARLPRHSCFRRRLLKREGVINPLPVLINRLVWPKAKRPRANRLGRRAKKLQSRDYCG